jgi:hypothetical protein
MTMLDRMPINMWSCLFFSRNVTIKTCFLFKIINILLIFKINYPTNLTT